MAATQHRTNFAPYFVHKKIKKRWNIFCFGDKQKRSWIYSPYVINFTTVQMRKEIEKLLITKCKNKYFVLLSTGNHPIPTRQPKATLHATKNRQENVLRTGLFFSPLPTKNLGVHASLKNQQRRVSDAVEITRKNHLKIKAFGKRPIECPIEDTAPVIYVR